MSISIKKPPVAPLEDDYLSYHDENVSEKQVDKFCFSLLNSIILNGGVVWKAPVIFKYKVSNFCGPVGLTALGSFRGATIQCYCIRSSPSIYAVNFHAHYRY